MNYLQSYLLDRMHQIKMHIKFLESCKDKCNSVSRYKELLTDLDYYNSLLNEIITIYQLYLEER